MTGMLEDGGGRDCPRRQWIDDEQRWIGMSAVLCARVAADRREWWRRVKSVVCPNRREATRATRRDVT